jgi:ABC-2 type transport system ATP-binding protein
MDTVQAIGLSKTYRDVAAVRDLDLRVRPGEFFGLLGPNGAGKSTTIGMLTTLVRPTSGTARVCGVDVRRRPLDVKRRIGMVSQHNTLDHEVTVAENLEFRGRYFGMARAAARRRADELLAAFDLTDKRRAMPEHLSGGQARRLAICRALVHRPEVLFLDEPTAGLDPRTRIHLWDTLRGLQAAGQTILLTTHYLEEAQALCDRVAIIDHGRLLACDTVAHLTAGGTSLETVFLTLTGREYQP